MSRATPELRNIAKRLMAYETLGKGASEAKIPADFHVDEKLRQNLATLMGKAGFRALLSRALALANAEVPWLRAVHVKANGTMEGLEELHGQLPAAEFTEGRVELLTQLLGLLVAFIGTSLTSQLVGEVWPQVSLKNLDFGK